MNKHFCKFRSSSILDYLNPSFSCILWGQFTAFLQSLKDTTFLNIEVCLSTKYYEAPHCLSMEKLSINDKILTDIFISVFCFCISFFISEGAFYNLGYFFHTKSGTLESACSASRVISYYRPVNCDSNSKKKF